MRNHSILTEIICRLAIVVISATFVGIPGSMERIMGISIILTINLLVIACFWWKLAFPSTTIYVIHS